MNTVRIEATPELCDALATAIDALESIADEYHAADLPNNEAGVRAHVLELHFLQVALLRARVLRSAGGGI